MIGLGDRTRTCGLTLPKRELYQLSYTQFGRSREGNVFHNGSQYTQELVPYPISTRHGVYPVVGTQSGV